MPSFSNNKQLKFVITLGTGKFGSSDNNQITLEGFRASVDIDKAGGVQMSTLRARVYGVSQDDMNSITTLQWKPETLLKNSVEVYAIDGDSNTLIFSGVIVNAWGDYNSMPDVFLHIQAQAAYYAQLAATSPRSFKGQVGVDVIMKQIAEEMGYVFENNGVTTQLVDVYLPNTSLEQAKTLARMANCNLYVDDKVLAITPANAPRANQTIPLVSKETGLVGYPTFDGIGVNFTSLFNPAFTFGGLIKLETDITQAAGEWVVTSLAHKLESQKPNGAWFTLLRGTLNGLAVTRR